MNRNEFARKSRSSALLSSPGCLTRPTLSRHSLRPNVLPRLAQDRTGPIHKPSYCKSVNRGISSVARQSGAVPISSVDTRGSTFRPSIIRDENVEKISLSQWSPHPNIDEADPFALVRMRGFEPNSRGLVTFFTPDVPTPSLRGKHGSAFVDILLGYPVALPNAVITNWYESWKSLRKKRTSCCMVISDVVDGVHKYFGMMYEDRTSLPYIPVHRVQIEYLAPRGRHGEPIIIVCMSVNSYNMICSTARKLVGDSSTISPMWEKSIFRSKVNIRCRAPHENKLWAICAGQRYEIDAVSLLHMKRAVDGTAFLVVKYRRPISCEVGELIFEFHSMMVQRDVGKMFGIVATQGEN